VPFGYKSTWLVINTVDANAVVLTLALKDVQPATWQEGVHGNHNVFVSPSILGWTSVLIRFLDVNEPRFLPLLETLSRQFGEVQYFGTHRVVDCHSWAKAIDGRVVRAYSWLGESGEVLLDLGERTPEEKELGFHFIDPLTVDRDWKTGDCPVEDDVIHIAAKWSLNPLEIDAHDSEGPGFIGKMP
jgi:hypothetical protein